MTEMDPLVMRKVYYIEAHPVNEGCQKRLRHVLRSETWTTLGPFNDLDTVYQAVPAGAAHYLRFVIETREPKPPPTWWDEHGEAVLFTGEAAFLMLAAWGLGMWLARLWRDNPRRWMDA